MSGLLKVKSIPLKHVYINNSDKPLTERVILVDEMDQPQGSMEKLRAHEEGRLHRAFSIFLFNSNQELLIHRRASEKYHSGGLWTNTCCSHPRPGETVIDAAHRRLEEEMGLKAEMEHKFHFIYKAKLDKGLIEHELDHVLFGFSDDKPNINPEEVDAWKYISMTSLEQQIRETPEAFTAWFKIAFNEVKAHLENLAA